eukprot:GHVN01026250.1.p2 GENE.GHVN01026250.1~~GHVN01026250.1.p2  ORF type:complete len:105 (-),score=21.04 GHVN01026250.1:99-413(-)
MVSPINQHQSALYLFHLHFLFFPSAALPILKGGFKLAKSLLSDDSRSKPHHRPVVVEPTTTTTTTTLPPKVSVKVGDFIFITMDESPSLTDADGEGFVSLRISE